MKLQGLEERRAARLSGREKVNYTPSVMRKIPRVRMPAPEPPPPPPVSEYEAGRIARELLDAIVLGSDSKLDASLESARQFLKRPIVPTSRASTPKHWTLGGKPVVHVAVSNQHGVITQVAIHHSRLPAFGEFCADLIQSWQAPENEEPEYSI